MKRYYFDWAATTPMSHEALQAYTKTATELFGNPSSVHSPGTHAGKALSRVRMQFSSLLGVPAKTLTFTSGGTESNALICDSFLMKRRKIHIIVSGIEHPSIYEYIQAFKQHGHTVTILPASSGMINPEALSQILTPDTSLILVMAVNNVLGTIQPIKEIRSVIDDFEMKHKKKIHLHVDAVQAFGKIDTDRYLPYVDSASASAHKIEGPKGMGLLYSKRPFMTVSSGGGQEFGLRPGTEDLPSIVSFFQTAHTYFSRSTENFDHALAMRSRFYDLLRAYPHIRFLSDREHTSPYIISLSIPKIPSEVFTRILDDRGISISIGSACSAKNRKKMQRVLLQSGIDQILCDSALRISFGPSITSNDIDVLAACVIEESQRLLNDLG